MTTRMKSIFVTFMVSVFSNCFASPPLPRLESFFSAPAHFAERLSQDGKWVAFLSAEQQGVNRLHIVNSDAPEVTKTISPSSTYGVNLFFWIGTHSLLWQESDSTGRTCLYTANIHSGKIKQILANEKRFISLQGVVDAEVPSILIGLSNEPSAFTDLYRVKLFSEDPPKLVYRNRHQIVTWAWDQMGNPVAGLSWTDRGGKIIRRLREEFTEIVFHANPEDDARILFASNDGEELVLLTNRHSDITYLERLNLISGKSQKIVSDPIGRVDIDQIICDDNMRKVMAVSFSSDGIRWLALDSWMEKMLEQITTSSGHQEIFCLGFDAAKTRFLYKTQSFQDPGTVLLHDQNSMDSKMLWHEYPDLKRCYVGKTEAMTYNARDGTKIPAYLTIPVNGDPPWPLVVFPHGGPRLRTNIGFDGRVQFLASRGYAVFQPNFRGSRGYGKAFMNAGAGQWGKGIMQNDVTDGVDALIKSGIIDQNKIAIFGGSYGGYAALAGLAFTPDRYAAGICLFGISNLYDYASVFSHETEAYAGDIQSQLGITHLEKARGRLNDLSPVNHAASIQAPLLLYHGAKDTLIPIEQATQMVSAMNKSQKIADVLISPDEGHGFARAESEMAVYHAIEIFLQEHLGGKVGPKPSNIVTETLDIFRQQEVSNMGP